MVAQQKVKLRVVHRPTESSMTTETGLNLKLLKLHQELDDIVKLIEKDIAQAPPSSDTS